MYSFPKELQFYVLLDCQTTLLQDPPMYRSQNETRPVVYSDELQSEAWLTQVPGSIFSNLEIC